MNAFFDALGKKVAEQWLSLLVLPGVLWVAAAVVAVRVGHRGAVDPRAYGTAASGWANPAEAPAGLVAPLVGLLLAAAAAGLAATALGALARRAMVARGRRRPARWLTSWRRHRWHAAQREVHDAVAEAVTTARREHQPLPGQSIVTGPEVADSLDRRDAIAVEAPQRPTWTGDRWLALTHRVHRAYGLDLNVVWPRLWSVLPETLRADVEAAHRARVSAGRLLGWAVLYAVLGTLWWPALLVTAAVAAAGAVRARAATETLCLLVETAADLHGGTLAEQVGVHEAGRLTPDAGSRVTALLRKDF